MGGEETLGLPRGLEPLQTSLALARGLVGVLGAIIKIPMLAMFHPWQDLALGGSVAPEFVGDDHARHVRQPFEQLAEELLRGLLISAALDQDIPDVPLLIHRPPQIGMLALDREKHLIHMPLVTRLGTAATELGGILLAECTAPFANRLIRHDYAAFQQ